MLQNTFKDRNDNQRNDDRLEKSRYGFVFIYMRTHTRTQTGSSSSSFILYFYKSSSLDIVCVFVVENRPCDAFRLHTQGDKEPGLRLDKEAAPPSPPPPHFPSKAVGDERRHKVFGFFPFSIHTMQTAYDALLYNLNPFFFYFI